MIDTAVDRKKLAAEYYAVTGEAVLEGDPIVTGALFFSHKLAEAAALAVQEIREAARQGALELREAGRSAGQELCEASLKVASEASEAAVKSDRATAAAHATIEKLLAERTQHLKVVEAQMLKCVKMVAKEQARRHGSPYISIWHAVLGAVVGAVALTAAVICGVEQGSAREREAAVGRSFSRVVPTLDPKLKEQLLEHIRKNPG